MTSAAPAATAATPDTAALPARPFVDRLQDLRAELRAVPLRFLVLELARGRSNAEISTNLHIGVETVKTHVGEVLRKLGLRDRIQAVVFAYEKGLVFPGE